MNKKRKIEDKETDVPFKKIKKSLKSKIHDVKTDEFRHTKNIKKDVSNEMKVKKPKVKKLVTSKEFFDKKKKNKPENVLKIKNGKHIIKNAKLEKSNEENKISKKKTKDKRNEKNDVINKLNDKEFKDRKKIRKMRSSIFDVATKCKQLWEEYRKFNLEPKKRTIISDEIFNLINGKCLSLIRAHDTSRVLQSMIKYGTQEQKNVIYLELKDNLINMVKSKYAKFCIRKFIKYSSKEHRIDILKILASNIILLMRHKDASNVVEYAYNNFANSAQRTTMVEQFYGPRFKLERTDADTTLTVFLTNHPESKTNVLSFFKDSLTSLIEKNILENSFIHKLFMDFLINSSGVVRAELIESMRENFVHILHTREGARATMYAVWHGTAKDRKAIIKSLKTYICKICCEEYGHLVLISLFDSVDDTKIVQKIILEEMLKSIDTVATDTYGRKILLYLLCPRNSEHFHPQVVAVLKLGDNNQHSKKEMSLRWDELSNWISNHLVEYVSNYLRRLALDNANLLFAINTLIYAKGDTSKGLKVLCEMVCDKFEGSVGERGFHLIDNSAGHYLLKKLIHNDSKKMALDDQCLFSTTLIDMLGEKPNTMKSWLNCNRGCFFIVTLLELKIKKVTDFIKAELAGCNKLLKKLNSTGSNILLKRLLED